ncbi:acetyl-CoA carboxylase biotin carboxylase subunit [Alicyclobacillus fastidiosus]|uniref:Acetyl-CoA carboxylase biotin carboxylase subunit n=1 Tax=Alicyclobacillus fastidiosus TaxID=392011 RepID=A0ABY6ZPA7_9BACL|nr:acetyl-CoA carboxylase biotin carboxylase subunit [Alicyclobacillus fastidiosus]WAH43901.1 acetyl-CoA carboxylase biotin carboxylase subunit [Alicyclobacillus fastidiosus]GMA60145.1 acetyl-CoA carboxylase biotin carboxylase [Alicyclobacillus fastidiosus]
MFQKVLIANRGEIARRIIRSCKRFNISTVAIYSDADADATHVREADEAVRIGPPPVAKSYLQAEAIVRAAVDAGADAVHPGYGLLSENPAFARLVEAAGLTFIGPTSDAIEAMGSKVNARMLMAQAGVPTVPGSLGAVASVEEARRVADDIGYPVMVKASSGGGGIGMQLVHTPEELERAFTSNQARAESYFGSGEMFLEKYVASPRHVEIQLLFDAHGNGVYLFERECSIQRRNQKVIEEAPSTFLTEELREAMGEAALSAGRAIGYRNAGTVEFLVDANRNFYFLEMNTRLQVEHPVTEMVTGLDLVEWQLRIAHGEALGFTQSQLQCSGHAIEARLYAEDPVRMLPSPGTITALTLPVGEGVRNDVSVEGPATITPFYDPMIGKLIIHADSRENAIKKLSEALSAYRIEGIKTNLPLLREIATSAAFFKGETTTDFIANLQASK